MLGYLDQCWWSRLAQPNMHAWTDGAALRLNQKESHKDDPDPKAISCYGVLRADTQQLWVRFVVGRPVSHLTTEFLAWVCESLAAEGKKAWLLVWDNASWHKSQEVRNWIKRHNRRVKREGGVRILKCLLPVKSPWLNPIEPHWVHGKRAIVEPERKLSGEEVMTRVCDYFGCARFPHLTQKVA